MMIWRILEMPVVWWHHQGWQKKMIIKEIANVVEEKRHFPHQMWFTRAKFKMLGIFTHTQWHVTWRLCWQEDVLVCSWSGKDIQILICWGWLQKWHQWFFLFCFLFLVLNMCFFQNSCVSLWNLSQLNFWFVISKFESISTEWKSGLSNHIFAQINLCN